MTDLGFDPFDQEFLGSDAVLEETMKALAGLELDKHRLRMQIVVSDGNADALTQNGTTLSAELDRIDAAIGKLKDAFGSLLYPAAAETSDGD